MDRALAAEIFTPAAREALRAFPVEAAEIELVAVSENVTFRIAGLASGEAYVLRLHRPGYHTDAALNSERTWTRALAEAGVNVPIPLAARDGRDYVSVFVPGAGQHRQAGMTHWIPGEILDDVLERDQGTEAHVRWFERLGAIAAAMHVQSSAWTPPAVFERHVLDIDGLMGEAPFWGPFWAHPGLSRAEQALLLETRERLRGALGRYGRAPSSFGVIHADLHTNNLLVHGDRLTVIDFDDTAFGWYLYDIAVALSGCQDRPDFAAIEAAFRKGYRTLRALPDEALGLIAMFRLVRGLAVIGWLHQRPEIDLGDRFKALKDRGCAQCTEFAEPC